MALVEGVYRMGHESGRLLLKTGRTGLGSRAGHDLIIEATSWNGRVSVDRTDPARSSVVVEVAAASFEIREGRGGVKPLTDSDRAQIKRNIGEILRTTQHPAITFRSASVRATPDAVVVEGDLTIMGVTRQATVRGTVSENGRVRGSTSVIQSQWGIKPYSAFLGALRLADEVEIQFDAHLVSESH